jgi:hypothetical protein
MARGGCSGRRRPGERSAWLSTKIAGAWSAHPYQTRHTCPSPRRSHPLPPPTLPPPHSLHEPQLLTTTTRPHLAPQCGLDRGTAIYTRRRGDTLSLYTQHTT